MKVSLIDYQRNALELLLYTKRTRLKTEMSYEEITAQSIEWKLDQLAYMLDTIKSSWEFADYTFEIEDVSRNFTHQVVRTRTASFAQEAQRVVDLSDADFLQPVDFGAAGQAILYHNTMENSVMAYKELVEFGMARQDARNVIPTGVLTSIIVKANLRTLHNMAELRLCFRVQDEYQSVFAEMKKRVVEVHPWADPFIEVFCVNHGTCAFPRYDKCPIQQYTIQGDLLAATKKILKDRHAITKHEANPVVGADGKTM